MADREPSARNVSRGVPGSRRLPRLVPPALVLTLAASAALGAGWTDRETVISAAGRAIVRADAAALILSGQQGGTLPMAAAAWPFPPVGETAFGKVPVGVTVELDGRALLAGRPAETPDTEPLEADVVLYVLGPGNEVLGHAAEHLRIDLEMHRARLADGGLKVLSRLTLGPGEHRLRVLARHRDDFALATLPVFVPETEADYLRTPVLADRPGTWLVALGTGAAELWTRDDLVPELPSSRPVVAVGPVVEADVLAAAGPRPELEALIVRSDDATDTYALPVEILSTDRLDAGTGSEPAVERHRIRFPTDEILPGCYALSLTTSADGTEAAASPPLAFCAVASASEASAGWTRLAGGGETSDVELVDLVRQAAAGPIERPPKEELLTAYRGVLAALAASDPGAGPRALEAAEGAIPFEQLKAVEQLGKAESRVLERALGGDRRGVLAIAFLHAERSKVNRDRRQSLLAAHNLDFALGLVKDQAVALATEEAAHDAACLIADLAGDLQQRGVVGQASRLFTDALSVDPDHVPALLGLAANQEKRGDWRGAVESLERLGRVVPDHAGARLRLALNLDRLGRGAQAEEILASLLTGDDPSWIRLVAGQELARIQADQRRLEDAERTLRLGLRIWPRHPGLNVQLAYVLDRRGDPFAARRQLETVADGVAGSVPDAEISSRFLYNRWPREDLRENHRILRQRAEAARDALPAALGQGPGKKP